jgi:Ca-activated chloride channel homolog
VVTFIIRQSASCALAAMANAVRTSVLGLFAIVSFLIPLTLVHAQQVTPSPPSESGYKFSVNVDEVVLHATVRNRKGTPVAGLGKDNFQVFEDGVPQTIKHFSHEDIPVTAGLVIDNSGSMRPKRAEVITAALAFAGSSNPRDQMFLVNFNEHVSFGLPHGTLFTDRPEELRTAMSTVIADGETALYDAVAVALEHLKQGNRDKKVLIVVSDGADNASVHTKAQMLQLATQSDAIVYSLGIYETDDPDKNPHVLSELSKASGGEAFFPESLREVVPICERIAHEIRNQYTISYIPTNQKLDGTYRVIQVHATSAGSGHLRVRARAGYIAPLKSAVTTTDTTRPEARN